MFSEDPWKMWQKFCKNKIVKFLASLKLAVCLIVSFTILMIWGTLIESSYNTLYAQWQVYLSPLFISAEILLFINILFAALVRFPFQKRLSGFYMIHAGLLTIFIGAALTAIYGLDGNIRLLPKKAARSVHINEPTLYAFYNRNNANTPMEFVESLPKVVKEYSQPDKPYLRVLDYELYLDRFLPFASAKYSWRPHKDKNKKSRVIALNLANAMFSQDVELSTLNPESRSQKMGPLTLTILPDITSTCFEKTIHKQTSKYLLQLNDQCLAVSELSEKGQTIRGNHIKIVMSKPFLKVVVTTADNKEYIFYPSLSTSPITETIRIDREAKAHLLELTPFTKNPQVVFFKNDRLGFGKGREWSYADMDVNKEETLPWMGFKLTLTRLIDNKYQHKDWFYHAPRGSESQRHFAAQVTLKHRYNEDDTETFWIDDTGLKKLTTKSGFNFDFMIGNKLHHLPFMLELDRFKMNTNPGTMNPASYESFVKVKEIVGSEEAHIYMNNPLKKDKYTFYQASYFQLPNGKDYGSVLSVNHDPGRPVKYGGSILLVLGSIIHFTIRSIRKRNKPKK